MITIDDFAKIELKVGTILEAEKIAESDKLIKLQVDLGEEQPRQILAGVKQWYEGEDLIGKQVIVVANLEPKKLMGYDSEGMLLAASCEDRPVFLTVSQPTPNGAKIR